MIDSYNIKKSFNELVDAVQNVEVRENSTSSDIKWLKSEIYDIRAGMQALAQAHATQVEYFNELVPGFTDAFNARRKLEEATRRDDERMYPQTTSQP